MSTSRMHVPITDTPDQRDAEDKARRQAERDGYRTLLVVRSHHVGPVQMHRWNVELIVEKRA